MQRIRRSEAGVQDDGQVRVVRDIMMMARDKGSHPSRGKTVQRWKRKTLSVGGAKLFRRAM